jgi:hypothetical protein
LSFEDFATKLALDSFHDGLNVIFTNVVIGDRITSTLILHALLNIVLVGKLLIEVLDSIVVVIRSRIIRVVAIDIMAKKIITTVIILLTRLEEVVAEVALAGDRSKESSRGALVKEELETKNWVLSTSSQFKNRESEGAWITLIPCLLGAGRWKLDGKRIIPAKDLKKSSIKGISTFTLVKLIASGISEGTK